MSSSATTTGDGNCKPDESNCTFLYLKKGDSRIIETVTAEGDAVTYQLDLDRSRPRRPTGPTKANASKHGKATDSSSDAPQGAQVHGRAGSSGASSRASRLSCGPSTASASRPRAARIAPAGGRPAGRGREVAFLEWRRCASRPPASRTAPGSWPWSRACPRASSSAPDDIDRDLARRQLGHGRGGRMKIESDRATVWGGIRHGRTLGSPVALLIENRDHANWAERMSPWPVDGEVEEVHLPRPGPRRPRRRPQVRPHRRPQRARARERARDGRAGGRRGRSRRRSCGSSASRSTATCCRSGRCSAPVRETERAGGLRAVDESPVRCLDEEASEAMVAEIDAARKANESLGGVFEVRAFGVLAGPRLVHLLGRAPRRPAGVRADVDPRDEGRRDRRRLRPRRARRLAGPRRDLLGRRARLRPRDEPRRRDRGRHDDRRAGRRARRDEAAADAHQAAALGRHRDEGAGRGAAGAHRLLHGARGRRRRRGDDGAGAGARLPREVRRRRDART